LPDASQNYPVVRSIFDEHSVAPLAQPVHLGRQPAPYDRVTSFSTG